MGPSGAAGVASGLLVCLLLVVVRHVPFTARDLNTAYITPQSCVHYEIRPDPMTRTKSLVYRTRPIDNTRHDGGNCQGSRVPPMFPSVRPLSLPTKLSKNEARFWLPGFTISPWRDSQGVKFGRYGGGSG